MGKLVNAHSRPSGIVQPVQSQPVTLKLEIASELQIAILFPEPKRRRTGVTQKAAVPSRVPDHSPHSTLNQFAPALKKLLRHLTSAVLLTCVFCPSSTAQTPVPHSFQSIAITSDSTALLRFAGRPAALFRNYYDLYPIEHSANLLNWEPLATLLRTNSITNLVEFLDLTSAHQLTRYYRTPTNHFPTAYPKPTGPHPVGTFTRFFADPTRTYRHGIKGNSSFLVSFWYPAAATVGKWPVPFMDSKIADWIYGAGSDDARRFAALVDHTHSGAPCATNGAPFPMLLYSHGNYGWRTENLHDFAELASHGFIVASADHLDCGATLTPGGQVVSAGDVGSDRKRYFDNKVADLHFISGSLSDLNRDDPILRERIDLEKKGAFGWSFGAGATLKLCLDDPSFLAFASLDGSLGDVLFRRTNSLQRPLILMGSTSVLFDYSTNSAYSFRLANSEHRTYADPLPFVESPSLVSRRVAQTIAGCLVSFFRKHLKNEDDAVLDDPTKVYPDAAGFRKK